MLSQSRFMVESKVRNGPVMSHDQRSGYIFFLTINSGIVANASYSLFVVKVLGCHQTLLVDS